MRLVFFDLETTGVDISKAEITSFQRLVRFDVERADPKALEINHFDPARWEKDAVWKQQALAEFFTWAKPHLDQPRLSARTNRTYYVGTLCGYNAAAFDGPILKRVCKDMASVSQPMGMFIPFDHRIRDTFQIALSICDFLGITLKDYKLGTVAEHFGAPIEKAH